MESCFLFLRVPSLGFPPQTPRLVDDFLSPLSSPVPPLVQSFQTSPSDDTIHTIISPHLPPKRNLTPGTMLWLFDDLSPLNHPLQPSERPSAQVTPDPFVLDSTRSRPIRIRLPPSVGFPRASVVLNPRSRLSPFRPLASSCERNRLDT